MGSAMKSIRGHRPQIRLNDEEKKVLDSLMAQLDRSASEIFRYALADYAKANGVVRGAHRPKRSTLQATD